MIFTREVLLERVLGSRVKNGRGGAGVMDFVVVVSTWAVVVEKVEVDEVDGLIVHAEIADVVVLVSISKLYSQIKYK